MQQTNKKYVWGAWIFGTILLCFLVWVFVFSPNVLPPFKYQLLGVFCALLGGLFAFFFVGTISARYEYNGLIVSATGGGAIFITVLAFWWSPVAPVSNYGQLLKNRQQEVTKQLVEESYTHKREGLEKIITLITTKMEDINGAYKDRSVKLQGVRLAISEFKNAFTPTQLEQAEKTLKKGNTVIVEALLIKLIEDDTEQSPEAAYQLGVLREAMLDYNKAGQYFREAFWRVPDNQKYRTASYRYNSVNELLTYAAWKNFEAKTYEAALDMADECITEFAQTATRFQQELETSNKPLPPKGVVADKEEKTLIFSRGLLNDAATCWYIKGYSLEKLKKTKEASAAYCEATRYTYARTYDPSWDGFWSPAQTASDRKMSLGGVCE